MSKAWQIETSRLLGLSPPTTFIWENTQRQELPQRKPRVLRDVGGDGNCLPRAISVAVNGSESGHSELRSRVTNLLKSRGEDENETARQAQPGEWMTDRALEGFALLLDTPIYSCVEDIPGKWSYHRHPHPGGEHVSGEGGIYIANIPKNMHFQIVKAP